ncbi:MAG TPA: hypothetical protein PKD85_20610 [Saprospiraceae bacterium]|nr:hypothetical protein [Saprospiraceae bacterium]
MKIKKLSKISIFLFGVLLVTIFYSCESNPYPVESDSTLLPIPIYALVGPNNDVKVYHENTRRMGEKLDFSFRKIDGASFRYKNSEYKISKIAKDEKERIFNTIDSSNFQSDFPITFLHNSSTSECILPQPIEFNFQITEIIEEPEFYLFKLNLNIVSQLPIQHGFSWKVDFQYDSINLGSFLDFKSLQRNLGIDNTFFPYYYDPTQILTNIIELEHIVYKKQVSSMNNLINLPNGLSFDKNMKLSITLYTLDKNIIKHIQNQGKNASGIENPLNLYAPTYQNISNALGFMGCFNTFTYKIER